MVTIAFSSGGHEGERSRVVFLSRRSHITIYGYSRCRSKASSGWLCFETEASAPLTYPIRLTNRHLGSAYLLPDYGAVATHLTYSNHWPPTQYHIVSERHPLYILEPSYRYLDTPLIDPPWRTHLYCILAQPCRGNSNDHRVDQAYVLR
jgi:hypothetical protein